MKSQTPAEGIMLTHEWGNSKMYKIVCGCGQPNHEHDLDIEADETGVNVNVYTTIKTNYWDETVKNRYDIDNVWLQEFDWAWKSLVNGIVRKVKLTWELWSTGAVTAQTTIAMTEQQAFNYAETLKSAVKDVKDFRNQQQAKKENTATIKQANEGDCV
jgi:hypothetical protein